jgi:hypothetical protein
LLLIIVYIGYSLGVDNHWPIDPARAIQGTGMVQLNDVSGDNPAVAL